MSNKNYYVNNNKPNMYRSTEKIENEVLDSAVEVNDSELEEEAVNVEELLETEDAVEEETVVGVVIGCEKLNIRKGPAINSDVLCTVPVNAVLVIDVNESTNEWYSVITESGCNGYCMKKYVKVSE